MRPAASSSGACTRKIIDRSADCSSNALPRARSRMLNTAAFGLFLLTICTVGEARTASPAPLHNPVVLNIGFVCKWDLRCMNRQDQAMRRALGFVRKSRPPAWKVQLCNRNASRKRTRVDWIGFNNCIRNKKLRQPTRARRPRR